MKSLNMRFIYIQVFSGLKRVVNLDRTENAHAPIPAKEPNSTWKQLNDAN